MTTRIQINPNLRLDADCTIADLDEDVFGDIPAMNEAVEVFEPESGLIGLGWVAAIDHQERTITVQVSWGSLTVPGTGTHATSAASAVLWMASGSASVSSARHSWSGSYSLSEV